MNFWPFVIAVGKYEDYDFVVVPDVIDERSRNFWRVSSFRANRAADEILFFDTLINGRAATCIYRTTFVTDGRSDVVVDSAGRPIFKSVGCLTFDPVGDKSLWTDAVAAVETKYREIIDRFVNFQASPNREWQPDSSRRQGWGKQQLLPPEMPWFVLPLRILQSILQNRVALIGLLVVSILLNLIQLVQIVRLELHVRDMSHRVVSVRRWRLPAPSDDIEKQRPAMVPDEESRPN